MTTYMRFPGGRSKAFTFSYDDGVKQDRRFVAILNRYNLHGTFNLNSSTLSAEIDPEKRVAHCELTQLYYPNHEVAMHGLHHPFFETLSDDNLMYEVLEDRKCLEADTGRVIRGMAYPYGTYNSRTLEVLRNIKVAYSRTTNSTHSFGIPEDWLLLHPTCHHSDPELFNLTDRFLNADCLRSPMMFYVWGHTYEFDNENTDKGWDYIENFCQKISGHEDTVWYATNGDIYRYVTEYRRLEFSLDGTIVYNPSAVDIYFAIRNLSGKTVEYTVKSGQTIHLD